MENIGYPNKKDDVKADVQAIRGYLNELADILNHNFEEIQNQLDELKKEEV